MKKYSVILHPDAEADINSSYQWGRKAYPTLSELAIQGALRELAHEKEATAGWGSRHTIGAQN